MFGYKFSDEYDFSIGGGRMWIYMINEEVYFKVKFSLYITSQKLRENLEKIGLAEKHVNGIVFKAMPFLLHVSISQKAAELPGVSMIVEHPVEHTQEALYTTIIDLNDRHKWTREAIADWIETFNEVPTFTAGVKDEDFTVLAYETRLPQSAFGRK